MANCIASFDNNDCDVTIWERNGKYEMEIKMSNQKESTVKMELDKYDITDMVRGFAEESKELAKEMIAEIVDAM